VARAINLMGHAPGAKLTPWVPLILLLEWAAAQEEENPRPGPEIVREWFEGLTGTNIPRPSEEQKLPA
jgi:hypothetical protein